jgi:hypothetical protein
MTALLVLAIAGIFATTLVGVWRAGFQAGLATAPYCEPAPESALLSAAEERVKVYRARAEFLERVQTIPADPLSLPWQVVPAPAEVSMLQRLADDLQDALAENAALRDLVAYKDMLRARYLRSLRTARMRLRAMVPVAELEAVEDLRTRSLSVARSAASRAADRAAVITEVEAAIFEASSLDDLNAQFELILADHGIERIAA